MVLLAVAGVMWLLVRRGRGGATAQPPQLATRIEPEAPSPAAVPYPESRPDAGAWAPSPPASTGAAPETGHPREVRGGTSPAAVPPASPRPVPARLPGLTAPAGTHACYLALLREADGLGEALPAERIEALRALLRTPHAPDAGLSLAEFNAVKNDVLDALIRQKRLPAGLGRQIAEMSRDRSLDPQWRDYCVQHLALYCERRWPAGSRMGADADAQAIQSACWSAVEETQGATAGTALIGLERLSRQYLEFDRARVADWALLLARSGNCSEAARTTALQVCGQMGVTAVLPAAREVAGSKASLPLRLSAIATIGNAR
jgi:hypothetical protein